MTESTEKMAETLLPGSPSFRPHDAPPPYEVEDSVHASAKEQRAQLMRAPTQAALLVQRIRNTPTQDALRFTVLLLAGTAALVGTAIVASVSCVLRVICLAQTNCC